jgi:hypothetical protein
MRNICTFVIRWGRTSAPAVFFLLLLAAPSLAQIQTEEPKPFKEFTVYKDKSTLNRFTPSGYMPNGECLNMRDAWQENCKEGKSCIKVIYDVACSLQSRQWAGVYWLNPADNWGDRKGGYNLTGAKKLVFWARGETGGEQVAEFKMGGIGQARDFPDSDTAGIGPVLLSREWRQYSIDLQGKDLSYISGGFAWVASVRDNPQSCTFYLDDIHYE